MFRKKVLVTIFSCLLVLLVSLLIGGHKPSYKMITRMIAVAPITTSKVDEDMEVIEEDTSKKQDIAEKEGDASFEGDTNTRDNDSKRSLANIEMAMGYKKSVYDGLTMQELASKLDRSLKNELSGKGYLYASYSLEKGVDPYLAVAISLEETGCNWNCSRLVRECNNVGGMKGKGCGSYGAFSTIDDGIKAFIDNIYRNYVRYGLTTADTMNPKYAANPAWSTNVNAYITRIKNK